MNMLSDELICCILDHVDAGTLLSSVQFVSKRLRRIALENQFWYRISPSASANDPISDSLYSHWTEVDWLSEWKWYELVFTVADCPRRNAPLRIEWIDDNATVLTFTKYGEDLVGLLDDGSLKMWRKFPTGWKEVGEIRGLGGRESFRLSQTNNNGLSAAHATAQLGYNNAISVGPGFLYFGAGRILEQVVRTPLLS
jgi:hypothetical protein